MRAIQTWVELDLLLANPRVEGYGLEVTAQHEGLESSWFGLNVVRSLNFSTFTSERIFYNLQFCVKD